MKDIGRGTIAVSGVIVVSALFTRQLYDYIRVTAGARSIEIGMAIAGAAIAITYLVTLSRKRVTEGGVCVGIGALLFGAILIAQATPFAVKTHVPQYALIGWLAMRDLDGSDKRPLGTVAWSLIFVSSVGFFNELVKAVLPYRVCDFYDAALDTAAGAAGIAMRYAFRFLKVGQRG